MGQYICKCNSVGQNARLIRGSSVVRVHTFAPKACFCSVEDSLAEELMPKLTVAQPTVKEWGNVGEAWLSVTHSISPTRACPPRGHKWCSAREYDIHSNISHICLNSSVDESERFIPVRSLV